MARVYCKAIRPTALDDRLYARGELITFDLDDSEDAQTMRELINEGRVIPAPDPINGKRPKSGLRNREDSWQ